MAMLYLEMKQDLEHFLEYGPGGLNKGATGLLNKAVRYIVNEYQGRWYHLLRFDQSESFDSTGYEVTIPSDFNVLAYLARSTDGQSKYHGSEYYRKVEGDLADLTDAPTRVWRFWDKQTPNGTVYSTYWRTAKEFADSTTEQYPDIPDSGQAILDTAKWLGLKEKAGSSPKLIEFWGREAQNQIRDLKSIDYAYGKDRTAVRADWNTDTHYATTYNPKDGGYTRGTGYEGPTARKDPSL